jgi:hypothetical protein
MMSTSDVLLQHTPELLGEIAARRVAPARAAMLVVLAVAGTSLFGAAVGSYVGGGQILHAAVKMPILFLGTLAVSVLLMHVLGALFRSGLAFDQTALLCVTSISMTGVVLGGFAPVMALFSVAAPYPSYNTYLCLVLAMVASIATGGIVSVMTLHRGLKASARDPGGAVRIILGWLLVYHFVGGQMAWLLRPFVGDNRDVFGGFSLERNLEGNIYEGIVNAVLAAMRTAGD